MLLFLPTPVDDDDEEDDWGIDLSRPVFVYKPVLKKKANRRQIRENEMLVAMEKRLNDDRTAAMAQFLASSNPTDRYRLWFAWLFDFYS